MGKEGKDSKISDTHLIQCPGVQYVSAETGFAKVRVLPPGREVPAVVTVTIKGAMRVACRCLDKETAEDGGIPSCNALLEQEPNLVHDEEARSSRIAPCPYVAKEGMETW
jgi:hypothetical protein